MARFALIVFFASPLAACTPADSAANDDGLGLTADGRTKAKPCNLDTECAVGQFCINHLCKAPSGTTTGGPSGTTTGISLDVPIPPVNDAGTGSDPGVTPVDVGGTTTGANDDVVVVVDSGGPIDLGVPDAGVPDTGPSNKDACPVAGTYTGCDAQQVCRVDEATHHLACSGSVYGFPIGSPCTEQTDCDILYGCHFGKCVRYCELKFGDAQCGFGEHCLSVGHPQFGACKPAS